MTKNEIRKEVLPRRKFIPLDEAIEENYKIFNKFIFMPEYEKAKEIFLYAAINGEVETIMFAHQALADEKKIAYPVCKEDGTMEFHYTDDPTELMPGYKDILEPCVTEDSLAIPMRSKKIFMVVPGIAFDHNMNRLGYGSGFYDRYFAKYGKKIFFKLGVGYDFQLYPEIEAEPHDVKMSAVITPKKLIYAPAEKNELESKN